MKGGVKMLKVKIQATNHFENKINELCDKMKFEKANDLIKFLIEKEYYQMQVEKNIKNEYLFYGEEKYNEERIRILQILLEKEYIYRTELFKKAFEEKALNNIKKIIESLQKNL